MPDLEPSPPENFSATQAATGSPIRFWILISMLLLALAGGSVLLKNSLSSFELKRKSDLPVLRQLKDPFIAIDRFGTEKSLADLEGKAVVLAYTYTRCPHGCAGVAAQMLKIRDAFPDQKNVHLVSIAVWPEIDTPPMLKAFSESIGVRANDSWWWLSTDRASTWTYLTNQIGFEPSREIAPADRLNAEDLVAHDLRAVLIDPQRRVRSYYSLMHPQTEVAQIALEKLKRDISLTLKE